MEQALWLATTLLIVRGCVGSSIEFRAVPSSVHLPTKAEELSLGDVPDINKFILGLSSYSPATWTGFGDLLSRPKALAVVTVAGVEKLGASSAANFALKDSDWDVDAVNTVLANTFGEKREWLEASSMGVSGSEIASAVQKAQIADSDVKTKVEPLRQEIGNILRIAKTISSSGARLRSNSSPDLYLIRISGLAVAAAVSPDEQEAALRELDGAIQKLTDALSVAYGEQAVVEVVAQGVVAPVDDITSSGHKVYKREATGREKQVQSLREALNVYVFTSSDYPAIFAIFAGFMIIFSISILAVAVGLWNMDPGKDSIIYRMTTTRMKKD